MKMKTLTLAICLAVTSLGASAKELGFEVQERISVAKGYIRAIQLADPVLVAQRGSVKNMKVIKVEQSSETATRVTLTYYFNDNVNGAKLLTDLVLVEDNAADFSEKDAPYSEGHLIKILDRNEKDLAN
ncbi:MAG: hypothetical protein ACXWQO_10355 [Bdellovibrionota bacterium]